MSPPDIRRWRSTYPGALIDHITGRRFTLSSHSNRMGYRLESSHHEEAVSAASVISAPVPTGAVQIPPGGEPILLMVDHASTGGYAIAGTVITADIGVAGQLAPGDWIEFAPCSLADADRAQRDVEALMMPGDA